MFSRRSPALIADVAAGTYHAPPPGVTWTLADARDVADKWNHGCATTTLRGHTLAPPHLLVGGGDAPVIVHRIPRLHEEASIWVVDGPFQILGRGSPYVIRDTITGTLYFGPKALGGEWQMAFAQAVVNAWNRGLDCAYHAWHFALPDEVRGRAADFAWSRMWGGVAP